MEPYLNQLTTMFGTWEDFKAVIKNANPNLNDDFSKIIKALPEDYITYFLQWMIDEENADIVVQNIDSIIQSIVSYRKPKKNWIEETIVLLSNLQKSEVSKSISDNLMRIINGPYKEGNAYKKGNLWTIFNLCDLCKDIGNSSEVIEQNYREILTAVFSDNEFLANNQEIISKIEDLIREIANLEGVRLSDIEHCGRGQYSECLKIGQSVLKFGKTRILEDIPTHKRILRPRFRRNIPSDYEKQITLGNLQSDDVLGLECQDVVDTKWHEGLSDAEIEEQLYTIYRDLRSSGIIWTDIKSKNVGKLLRPNTVELVVKDSNGQDVTIPSVLLSGELVVFDTDRIYTKGKVPKFDESPLLLGEDLYKKFEERFANDENIQHIKS